MEEVRGRFQGVTNIIRFNWHFYVLALVVVTGLIVVSKFVSPGVSTLLMVIVSTAILSTVLSLAASFYIYDCSNLYSLEWLDISGDRELKVVNINAGFDETSVTLSKKYPSADLMVFDFYDPDKHTELSIERARKALS